MVLHLLAYLSGVTIWTFNKCPKTSGKGQGDASLHQKYFRHNKVKYPFTRVSNDFPKSKVSCSRSLWFGPIFNFKGWCWQLIFLFTCHLFIDSISENFIELDELFPMSSHLSIQSIPITRNVRDKFFELLERWNWCISSLECIFTIQFEFQTRILGTSGPLRLSLSAPTSFLCLASTTSSKDDGFFLSSSTSFRLFSWFHNKPPTIPSEAT